jgi:hypothetical protein
MKTDFVLVNLFVKVTKHVYFQLKEQLFYATLYSKEYIILIYKRVYAFKGGNLSVSYLNLRTRIPKFGLRRT